ncbi:MAG: AEC family transporter [Veillonellaceae bacterium]|nr:AEC family transporter [Veillonellaceae bacterium]
MEFIHILVFDMLPLFGVAAMGYWLDSLFPMDVKSLTRIVFYLILPAFVFRSIFATHLSFDLVQLFLAGIVLFSLHAVLTSIIAKIRDYDSGMTEAFRVGTMFNNCGNVGVSMIALIYSGAPFVHDGVRPYYNLAMAGITVLLILMNTSVNTVGLYLAGRGRMTPRDAVLMIARMPVPYVLGLVVFCKYFAIPVDRWFVWHMLEMPAVCLPFIAMLILGIQLHRTQLTWLNPDVWLAIVCRLIGGPLFALLIIYIYGGFTPLMAQVFFIFSAVPSAVNSVMFAVEFDNYPGFATQVVMMGFVVSCLTLTTVIFLARYLFPLPMW